MNYNANVTLIILQMIKFGNYSSHSQIQLKNKLLYVTVYNIRITSGLLAQKLQFRYYTVIKSQL